MPVKKNPNRCNDKRTAEVLTNTIKVASIASEALNVGSYVMRKATQNFTSLKNRVNVAKNYDLMGASRNFMEAVQFNSTLAIDTLFNPFQRLQKIKEKIKNYKDDEKNEILTLTIFSDFVDGKLFFKNTIDKEMGYERPISDVFNLSKDFNQKDKSYLILEQEIKAELEKGHTIRVEYTNPEFDRNQKNFELSAPKISKQDGTTKYTTKILRDIFIDKEGNLQQKVIVKSSNKKFSVRAFIKNLDEKFAEIPQKFKTQKTIDEKLKNSKIPIFKKNFEKVMDSFDSEVGKPFDFEKSFSSNNIKNINFKTLIIERKAKGYSSNDVDRILNSKKGKEYESIVFELKKEYDSVGKELLQKDLLVGLQEGFFPMSKAMFKSLDSSKIEILNDSNAGDVTRDLKFSKGLRRSTTEEMFDKGEISLRNMHLWLTDGYINNATDAIFKKKVIEDLIDSNNIIETEDLAKFQKKGQNLSKIKNPNPTDIANLKEIKRNFGLDGKKYASTIFYKNKKYSLKADLHLNLNLFDIVDTLPSLADLNSDNQNIYKSLSNQGKVRIESPMRDSIVLNIAKMTVGGYLKTIASRGAELLQAQRGLADFFSLSVSTVLTGGIVPNGKIGSYKNVIDVLANGLPAILPIVGDRNFKARFNPKFKILTNDNKSIQLDFLSDNVIIKNNVKIRKGLDKALAKLSNLTNEAFNSNILKLSNRLTTVFLIKTANEQTIFYVKLNTMLELSKILSQSGKSLKDYKLNPMGFARELTRAQLKADNKAPQLGMASTSSSALQNLKRDGVSSLLSIVTEISLFQTEKIGNLNRNISALENRLKLEEQIEIAKNSGDQNRVDELQADLRDNSFTALGDNIANKFIYGFLASGLYTLIMASQGYEKLENDEDEYKSILTYTGLGVAQREMLRANTPAVPMIFYNNDEIIVVDGGRLESSSTEQFNAAIVNPLIYIFQNIPATSGITQDIADSLNEIFGTSYGKKDWTAVSNDFDRIFGSIPVIGGLPNLAYQGVKASQGKEAAVAPAIQDIGTDIADILFSLPKNAIANLSDILNKSLAMTVNQRDGVIVEYKATNGLQTAIGTDLSFALYNAQKQVFGSENELLKPEVRQYAVGKSGGRLIREDSEITLKGKIFTLFPGVIGVYDRQAYEESRRKNEELENK